MIEGGEIAGINGFMHQIDNVLIYEPDLRAEAVRTELRHFWVIVASVLFMGFLRWRTDYGGYFLIILLMYSEFATLIFM